MVLKKLGHLTWKRVIALFGILYIIVWIGGSVWVSMLSKRPLLEGVFDSSTLCIAFFLSFLLAFTIFTIIGTIGTFCSKTLATRWKLLVAALIGIIALEAAWIRYKWQRPVQPPYGFQFYDRLRDSPEIANAYGDGHVSAKGTWTSSTKLANLVETTRLDCWKHMASCIEITAFVSRDFGGNSLNVASTYWDIQDWGQDRIIVKENASPLCVTEILTVDRRNKVVTRTRVTKQPKPEGCEFISDEPIVSHLAAATPQ